MHRVNGVENHLGIELLSVRLKTRHQFRALHAICIRRPVFHIGGGHQLTALLHARDEGGLEIRARRIHRRRVARRA